LLAPRQLQAVLPRLPPKTGPESKQLRSNADQVFPSQTCRRYSPRASILQSIGQCQTSVINRGKNCRSEICFTDPVDDSKGQTAAPEIESTGRYQMSRLFTEQVINTMSVKNRFVRSATWEGLAGLDGGATAELIDTMTALAEGGVGLIATSHAFVSPEGQATPRQLGIHDDALIPGLQEMVSAVHAHDAKIVIQLAHAGVHATAELTRQAAIAVSGSHDLPEGSVRVATVADIEALVASFAQAAGRAQQAGFDGVELHSAHGYLLSQFLSPAYNRRDDDYGGSIGNRARIHLQIYRAIRAVVGKDYPILIKMNCADFIDNGLTGADALTAATLLADEGFDAIEVSGGTILSGKLSPSRPGIAAADQEAYFKEYAGRIKKAINVPVILVGGVRSFEVAQAIIGDGTADFIAMSRPLIREPALVNRWQSGDRRRAACTSDNLCFKPGFIGRGVYCVTAEKEALKRTNAA
jgi:2,4-dienoyl-CoA reductase-like NADH-dependent reductase (Old Yellow Enzyme family)